MRKKVQFKKVLTNNLMACSNIFSCYKFFPGLGAISSVGRASRLHREGREFESLIAHQQFGGVAQLG